MSDLTQAFAALRHWLRRWDMETEGVTLIVQFPDEPTRQRAEMCLKHDFEQATMKVDINGPLVDTVMGVPFRFTVGGKVEKLEDDLSRARDGLKDLASRAHAHLARSQTSY